MKQPVRLYRTMVLIRTFEERCAALYQRGVIRGTIHLAVGQEAVPAGVCAALSQDDYVTCTYRGNGPTLARGAEPKLVLAEILGKASGLSHGKGGKMHLTDIRHGLLGANGIVAAGIPVATGAALTSRLLRQGRVAVAFFGDGATNQGAFHESLNLAAAWDLPVVFVCENNAYAEMTPIGATVRIATLATRAAAYGIPGVTVDGNDAEAVCEECLRAVERARSGDGPTLLEARTYRLSGHYYGDPETYRPRQEVEEAWRRDPIPRLRSRLLNAGMAEKELAALEGEVRRVVDEAEEYAVAAELPVAEHARRGVFADA